MGAYINYETFEQVTDGNIGGGSIGRSRIIQGLPLPAPYPVRIHVLPIASPADPCLTHGNNYLRLLLIINCLCFIALSLIIHLSL